LPEIHLDPFDRLIIATALHHWAPIVTADTTIPSYPGIRVVW
jgi:PIN domain nuclease of toxin-antitoxin system